MPLDISALFMDILETDPHRQRTNHLLKVTSYATIIAECEGMSREELPTLRAAAMLHDIGIRPSKEKYGSSEGKYQQVEGPILARGLLAKYACPEQLVERVCYLIAHHHEYDNIVGLDYQILVEADFLVNCDEGTMPKEKVAAIRAAIFKTGTGMRILDGLFELI